MMIHWMVYHRFVVLCISVLAAIPFLIRIPEIKTVDNLDYFAIQNNRDMAFYESLKTIFGNDEFFIIAFKKDNLFTEKHLTLLKELTDQLAGIEGIREIKSLANIDDTIGEDNFFIVRKFLETIPDDPCSLEKLKKNALGNPLYAKNLLSQDGNTAAIVAFLHERPDEPDFRKKIIAEAETILEKHQADTGTVHIAGWTVTSLVLSGYMKQDIATFIPVSYGFIVLAMFLFFRNVRLTLIAAVNISLCMGCTMGLFPILGITLNNVTTIVPPAVIALALCDTVHIFSNLDQDLFDQYPDKRETFKVILKKLVGPCFLTTLTTFVGFLSLYMSDISPIREFSLLASVGIVFEFFFAFTFLPAVLLLSDERKITRPRNRSDSLQWNMTIYLARLSNFVFRYFRIIFLTGVGLIVISIWLSLKISVETDLLAYFKKKSPVRISTEFVEKELAGTGTLDISFKTVEKDTFRQPWALRMIETLQNHVTSITGVDNTLSFIDFIKDMNKSFHNENPEFYRIPDSSDLISQYLLIYESDGIRNFVNESLNHARMSVRISEHSSRNQSEIIRQIQKFIETMDRQGMDIQVSGLVLQEVNTIDALVKGQVLSMTVSVIIILVIMFFVLRSFPLWLLSILPNLFPIALHFGMMGLFRIPLNTATALVATVAVCIAVDDTIHFLTEFKRNLTGHPDVRLAIQTSIQNKGRAIISSSMVLTIGFGVMVFSRFVPTINFGALSAGIMITAMIGDLLLLPASALMFPSMIKTGGCKK